MVVQLDGHDREVRRDARLDDLLSARATDNEGNVSAWSTRACTSVPLDDRDLRRLTRWHSRDCRSKECFLGTLTKQWVTGSKLAARKISARSLALVAWTGFSYGTVAVRWNGMPVKRMNLCRAGNVFRPLQVLRIVRFPSVRTGRLTLTITTALRRVPIDGLVVSK